jgi:hypothetical protein
MNKHNKRKFNEVKGSAEVDEKHFHNFLDYISFWEVLKLVAGCTFKTRRGCLFLSCMSRGMSCYAAHKYAFKSSMGNVIEMLDSHGWDIAFGKFA